MRWWCRPQQLSRFLLRESVPSRSCRSLQQRSFPYRILFYGSDQFSLETLRLLHDNSKLDVQHAQRFVKHLHVCTMSEQNVITTYCKKAADIQVHRWPYELPTDHYDVGVVVSFGKMIPAASIDRCKFGMLNVHGSLLPAFRGAAPIHRAILSGCRETGVTIMRLAARRFDVGEILLQQPIELSETSRTSQVYPQMARLGAQLLLQCLQDLPFYLSRARSQNDQEASYAPKVKDHEAAIDWSNMNSSLIYRMFRAFDLFVHLHCHWIDGSRLSLYQMATPEQTRALQIDSVLARFAPALVPHLQPGLLYYHKPQKLICVRCADHKWVAFGSVCLKNFKTMNALQFHNGFISKVSAKNTLPVILK